MYNVTTLLQKINHPNGIQTLRKHITLADMLPLSPGEIRELSDGLLTRDETDYLYAATREALKENKKTEIAVLSRANPQLKNMLSLDVQPSSEERGYEELLGGRAFSFTKPGSVSSMFSPAGYLTELYREAKDLHPSGSIHKEYHLDHRRPDLKSLVLNQKNMTGEISTLSLANEIVLKNMMAATSNDNAGAIELLSTYRQMGENPFHLPYQILRQSMLSQDESLSLLTKNPDVGNIFDPAALLAIKYDVSPELYKILTEEITESNASELIKNNFGNIDVANFMQPTQLAYYYGISYDEFKALVGIYDGGEFQYTNNKLIYQKNNGLDIFEVQRTYGKNTSYYYLQYVDLFPQGDKFVLDVLFSYMPFAIIKILVGTTGDGSHDLATQELPTLAYQRNDYKIVLSLTEAQLLSGVAITISRVRNDGLVMFPAVINFKLVKKDAKISLLKLNKVIRLYKAIGMTPEETLHVSGATHYADLTINKSILEQLFYVKHYTERYRIDSSKARVLANRDISLIAEEDQPSLFNRLFNTPLLNGKEFSASGNLDLTPEAKLTDTQAHQLAVIKRAFRVNDIELLALWKMAKASESVTTMECSLQNLSALYRLCLLAEVHHLSVEELVFLTRVSPWKMSKVVGQEDKAIAERIEFLYHTTQWLTEQRWTVAMIFLMTTDRYSDTTTPEIQELKQTLYEVLQPVGYSEKDEDVDAEKRAKLTSEEKWNTITSNIAAAMQLDSNEKARLILQWADGIQPDNMNTDTFLALVRKTENTADEKKKIAQFAQCLAQLSLIVNSLMLNEAELSLMINKPSVLHSRATTLQHDITTLYKIAHFHDKLNQTSTHASEILTSLREGTLSAEQLARALDLDPKAVTQALAQIKGKKYLRETEVKCGAEAAHVLEALRTGQITPQQLACALDLDLDAISPSLKKNNIQCNVCLRRLGRSGTGTTVAGSC